MQKLDELLKEILRIFFSLNAPPSRITTLSPESLLIFTSIGITVLTFSLKTRLEYRMSEELLDLRKASIISDIYYYVKELFEWGWLYILAALFILLSSAVSEYKYLNPLLLNMGFFSGTLITALILIKYVTTVLRVALNNFVLARYGGI